MRIPALKFIFCALLIAGFFPAASPAMTIPFKQKFGSGPPTRIGAVIFLMIADRRLLRKESRTEKGLMPFPAVPTFAVLLPVGITQVKKPGVTWLLK